MARQYTGLTRDALRAGDAEAALSSQRLAFKQYRMMHTGLERIMRLMLETSVAEYRSSQEGDGKRFEEAVRAGEFDRAEELLEEHRDLHRRFHDMYVDWFAELCSAWHERYGTERFYELMRSAGEDFAGDFAAWAKLSPEELLDSSIFMQLSHPDGWAEIEEDEEKFTIHQGCGTGGRLMAEGRFDGEGALQRIPTDHPASLGEAGLPTYCAHCAIWNTVMTSEREDGPLWVIDHPHDSSCTITIYKDRSKVPAEYLERLRSRGPGAPDSEARDRRSPGG